MADESPTFRDFNPGQNHNADRIKQLTDELIEFVKWAGKDQRRVSLAVTNYEQAAMWAVKSLF